MSIVNVGKSCCGCRACGLVCPKDAIVFVTDEYGFEYPFLDEKKCINCNKCDKVCPSLNTPKDKLHIMCGAAYAKDETVKYVGSSGGLFGIFATKILEAGGVVYGAAFDDSHRLKTTRAQSGEDLSKLYKSKYLLCDTDDQFKNIKADLEADKKVLYCSSPCQINALKLYLGKEYQDLVTVDFVCHGVGSQTLFDQSLKYVETKKNIKINDYMFRYKKGKSTSHYYRIAYSKDGRIKSDSSIYLFDPYYNAYQKRLLCRDACYDCAYASENRPSDITIGDFHTINKYYPDIDRFAGVSMFVCNTDKGRDFFLTVEDQMEVRKMAWEEVKKNNRFDNTEKKPENREGFLSVLKNDGFDKVVDTYLRPSLNWTHIVYYYSPKFLRKIAFKMFGK